MIQATSILAFQDTVSERSIQVSQLLGVYLSLGPMSDRAAAKRMKLPPSQVSARRNDLVKLGKVCEMGREKDPETRKLVITWGVVKNTLFD